MSEGSPSSSPIAFFNLGGKSLLVGEGEGFFFLVRGIRCCLDLVVC